MLRIAVLVSGGGSNLQAIIDGVKDGSLDCEIKYVIADSEKAYGLERARVNGIEAISFDRKEYKREISNKILELIKNKVDLIVLAGYLSILDGEILKEFRNRIINIHPSLIPSFCGGGMYGIKVHEAAIKKGVKYSGCTVHFVNEEVDGGEILLQKVVPVLQEDTPKELQERILIEEHKILPEAIKLISEGKVKIENGRCYLV
ncbi:phosphoribosylglycinamide formyltransferase [Clostridium intestinale]|uniref:Phosphoribosylglycinamide formyltransferase n=1 Tax=Clostridium intestinale DSM 6191 TaxID=1121320 RepID=A0A1M5SVU2_9CLOT|nr:phosphoribosylglycinamide formyltransferase [Clostridium intestinale]SHH42580.1 formyltetrahydrofolate-dependent phosphoribosylglycinamide formyltransferase [Clostridium intestinale DSM 6191]